MFRLSGARGTLLISVMVPVLVTGSAVLAYAQDFYAGKTVSVIVSGASAYESYTRSLSRVMPKYIPGKPAMIVELMSGGGGLRAANVIAKIAPRDGSHGLIVSGWVVM